MQTIYRQEYWDAMACEELPTGFDLCVFDAAVNSGVGRARQWVKANAVNDIDAYCDQRLKYLNASADYGVYLALAGIGVSLRYGSRRVL